MSFQKRLTSPRIWAATIVIIVILVTLLVGTRTNTSGAYSWQSVQTIGATHALSTPALLPMQETPALIWQSSTTDAPLYWQSLTGHHTATGILPYPDVLPERWQVAPASDDAYHIIWVEQDHRLRSALIDLDGQTQRGPILLAPRARHDFTTLALLDRSLLVLWIVPDTRQVSAQIIDFAGRPNPVMTLPFNRAEHVTAAQDLTGTLHLAWIDTATPGRLAIRYQTAMPDNLSENTPITLHTLDVLPTETITAFLMGLDQTHAYLVWSITSAEQPDAARVYTLTFPLDQPENTQVNELLLPQYPGSYHSITIDSPALDRVRSLAADFEPAAALRWPRLASGQHTILPLAITYRTQGGWRPGVVYYQGGQSLGYQHVADRPADAGPPAITHDPDGHLFAAWTGLNGTTPTLYTATLDERGLAAPSGDHPLIILIAIFAGTLAGLGVLGAVATAILINY